MEDEKIRTFIRKVSSKFHKSVLQQNKPLNTLNDIHNWFVVIQIDKANKDVEVICQWFYALVLVKELALDHNNTCTNKTYNPVYKTNNQVIFCGTTFLRNKLTW